MLFNRVDMRSYSLLPITSHTEAQRDMLSGDSKAISKCGAYAEDWNAVEQRVFVAFQ